MKCSIASDEAQRCWEPEEALRRIREAGFESVDYGLFQPAESAFWQSGWEEHARRVKRAADAAGIAVGQTHAPFPTSGTDAESDETIFRAVANSIRATALMGCPYAVVHSQVPDGLDYTLHREEVWERNLRFYHRLAPVARESGVTVAIENLFVYDPDQDSYRPMVCSSPDSLIQLIDALGEGFAACLDTGHALLNGFQPSTFVHALGDRLRVLHVHDNDGLDDRHTAPYLGKIDWDAFCGALQDIRYGGTFSFETFAFCDRFPEASLPDAMAFLGRLGRRMADRSTAL